MGKQSTVAAAGRANRVAPQGAVATNQQQAAGQADRSDIYQFVVDLVSEERSLLFALATTIAQNLEPADPDDPPDDAKLVEWRLAMLLEDRLSKTSFEDGVRQLLFGRAARDAGEVSR